MAYRLSGTYVGHCDCQQVCPCAMDGPPTGRDGQCRGLLVFAIKDEGGTFGEFVPLIGECLGVERAAVSFSNGDEPSAKIGDTDVTFEAFKGPDGNPTTASNTAFGFAPVFTLGQSSGSSGLFGESFEANYGEAAEFEYTS
jgi:hypothetical protein